MVREQERLVASVEILLGCLRGLAAAISADLAGVEDVPGMVPAIPLHGRPLTGFAAIFMAAREVEAALEMVKGGLAEPETPLSNMQTQGSA